MNVTVPRLIRVSYQPPGGQDGRARSQACTPVRAHGHHGRLLLSLRAGQSTASPAVEKRIGTESPKRGRTLDVETFKFPLHERHALELELEPPSTPRCWHRHSFLVLRYLLINPSDMNDGTHHNSTVTTDAIHVNLSDLTWQSDPRDLCKPQTMTSPLVRLSPTDLSTHTQDPLDMLSLPVESVAALESDVSVDDETSSSASTPLEPSCDGEGSTTRTSELQGIDILDLRHLATISESIRQAALLVSGTPSESAEQLFQGLYTELETSVEYKRSYDGDAWGVFETSTRQILRNAQILTDRYLELPLVSRRTPPMP